MIYNCQLSFTVLSQQPTNSTTSYGPTVIIYVINFKFICVVHITAICNTNFMIGNMFVVLINDKRVLLELKNVSMKV